MSGLVVQNPPANAGDIRDAGSIPGSGRSLEKEMATYSSFLAWRIPMDRGAWRATVHGVAKSWTGLSNFTLTFTFWLDNIAFKEHILFGIYFLKFVGTIIMALYFVNFFYKCT